MIQYKCCLCGAELEFDDLKRIEESRGEFWGTPCYETIYVCPHCGSDDIEELEEYDDEEENED